MYNYNLNLEMHTILLYLKEYYKSRELLHGSVLTGPSSGSKKVEVKQSRYRPGVAQRVPGS
jgi:hypothetical protein